MRSVQSFCPSFHTHCRFKFLDNLFIWDKHFLCLKIIRQIAQMYQKRQHIILHLKTAHIIPKTACIHPDAPTAKHLYNIRTKSIKIHINIGFQCIVNLC